MTPCEQEKFVKDFYTDRNSEGLRDFVVKLFILSEKENSLNEIKVLAKILKISIEYALDDSKEYEFKILEELYLELFEELAAEKWGPQTIEFSNDIHTRMNLIL